MGHTITILTYLAIIVAFSLTCSPGAPIRPLNVWVAKRLGWISIVNMIAAVVLALKNTPLGPLTGFSYEKLNLLHRVSGQTTFYCALIHTALYINYLIQHKNTAFLSSSQAVNGMVAMVSLFVIVAVSIRPIRQRCYELFYAIHTVCYIILIVFTCLHKPELTRKMVWTLVFIAATCVAARILRFLKLIYNSFGNAATLIPLEDGATRVIFDKPIAARPGDHVLINIPGIKLFQSHPFTIADTLNTQLVIRGRGKGGFTDELHTYAEKNPGGKVRILVDGPFGKTPDFKQFDKSLIIVGGVGSTFGLAVALDMVRSPTWTVGNVAKMIVVFRLESHIDWFREELLEIQQSDRVDLTIHVTRLRDASRSVSTINIPLSKSEISVEKDLKDLKAEVSSIHSSKNSQFLIEDGKPNINLAVSDIIKSAERTDNVIVSVCGPAALMNDVRNTVARNIPISGPSVTLMSEQFGM